VLTIDLKAWYYGWIVKRCVVVMLYKSGLFLRQSQQRVAQSAAKCVLGPPILPRICLIQGPPGTGKTTTIIDIISRILSSTKVSHFMSASNVNRAHQVAAHVW